MRWRPASTSGATACSRCIRASCACRSTGTSCSPIPRSRPTCAIPPTAACAACRRAARSAGSPTSWRRSPRCSVPSVGVPQVQIVIAGVPDWAASPASGCERKDAGPRSRPINAAGLEAYKALITQVAALAAEQGADGPVVEPMERAQPPRLHQPAARGLQPWTRPRWRRPSTPSWCSPPRPRWTPRPAISSSCSARWPARPSPRPRRSTVAGDGRRAARRGACARAGHGPSTTTRRSRRIPASPTRSSRWSRRSTRGRARRARTSGSPRPASAATTPALERPLDDASLRAQCRAQDAALRRWADDPRVDAAFQYTFREDTAYPVGLADAGLTRIYPTYDLWAAWGARGPTDPPPALPPSCA